MDGTNFEQMLGLNFVGMKHSSGRNFSEADVSISKLKNGINITFRNECWKNLGDRLVIAIKDNCVYFKQDTNGWGLSTCKTTKEDGPRYMRIAGSAVPKDLYNFIGDYELKVMNPIMLHYIQKHDK